jgi:hypothetical protein
MKNPELFRWLRANLGKQCLASLTGYDAPALVAAYAIAEATCNADSTQLPDLHHAFRHVVLTMQPKCRGLAYHAIAKARAWNTRIVVWHRAGLPDADIPMTECSFAPGGSMQDLTRVG